MKIKSILLLTIIVLFPVSAKSQCAELFATSEEDMYKIYNQMLDSSRISNYCLYPGKIDCFSFGFWGEMDSDADTIAKFEQVCDRTLHDDYICRHSYLLYISKNVSVDFYERYLDYLKGLDKIENYCIRNAPNWDLSKIRDALIRHYESGVLNQKDSIKALKLIERTLLESVSRDNHYYSVIFNEKYVTDNVREALVDAIKHPFYPTEYYDVFMSYQDTLSIDTTGLGIPDTTKAKYGKNLKRFYPEEIGYYERLRDFFTYEKLGKEQGISSGQAYLKDKSKWFMDKGYLPINTIAEYAYKKQDKLLIKHLKEFKKKHPGYPLKYF
jgi:hypothetical protein